uniref:Thionin-like protein 2 n=1 Tax=Nicotiana tabacum TaxID=4097 RepID=A0A1S4CKB6_TOBAC|nr:uncharacterized protein LOC104109046 [Nicotiana tomentosiformis]XP_016501359.1 PREDICTED: uncharacterized protein LOC107819733 [Nicotiana tabacum]
MERISVFVTLFIVLIVVGKEMHNVSADSPYACWGGCYNQCIILSFQAGTIPNNNNPCYVQCLSKCIPRSAAEYQNYCKIGCSLELCVPTRSDAGADLDKCFGNCGNVCRA